MIILKKKLFPCKKRNCRRFRTVGMLPAWPVCGGLLLHRPGWCLGCCYNHDSRCIVKTTRVPRLLCTCKCFMTYLRRHIWEGIFFSGHRWAVASLQILLQWIFWWSQRCLTHEPFQPLQSALLAGTPEVFSFWCWIPPLLQYVQSVCFQKLREFYVRIYPESRIFLLPVLL